ncbi:hypothetical protein ACO34A_24650 (plasmid) [Rhizobium sp. ACO-34A]|nr:hypothetical protein ACO34A_24650 [Rhizobium sp. ACO-34A]
MGEKVGQLESCARQPDRLTPSKAEIYNKHAVAPKAAEKRGTSVKASSSGGVRVNSAIKENGRWKYKGLRLWNSLELNRTRWFSSK